MRKTQLRNAYSSLFRQYGKVIPKEVYTQPAVETPKPPTKPQPKPEPEPIRETEPKAIVIPDPQPTRKVKRVTVKEEELPKDLKQTLINAVKADVHREFSSQCGKRSGEVRKAKALQLAKEADEEVQKNFEGLSPKTVKRRLNKEKKTVNLLKRSLDRMTREMKTKKVEVDETNIDSDGESV